MTLQTFKKTISFLIFFISSIFITNALADSDPAPMVMLKNTANAMIAQLNKHLGQLKNNDALVRNIVKTTVLPHFDLTTMGQAVVGRAYWQQASSATQQQFLQEFVDYVINTYSAAISSYDGETIKFYPIRGDITGKRLVQINSDLLHKDGPPIQIQYNVLNKGGTWLIYDFSIDGVSLIQNYRSQFASTLRTGGLNQLVIELAKRNK